MRTQDTYRELPATQAEIARLAGCTRQTVAKWQKGGSVLDITEAAIIRAIRAVEKGRAVMKEELEAA